jgi:ATP-dependent exoDNAse (exonuclease V) beta subunit
MHLAKKSGIPRPRGHGLIPLQERIESVGDGADLEEVYNTERHLLYVACTRARDHLLVTGVDPASEFLVDLAPSPVGDGKGSGRLSTAAPSDGLAVAVDTGVDVRAAE